MRKFIFSFLIALTFSQVIQAAQYNELSIPLRFETYVPSCIIDPNDPSYDENCTLRYSNLYSPERFDSVAIGADPLSNGYKRMALGGWKEYSDIFQFQNPCIASEHIIPPEFKDTPYCWVLQPDKIYMSELQRYFFPGTNTLSPIHSVWSEPVEIYAVENTQINDPSIVRVPHPRRPGVSPDILYMYMTAIEFDPYQRLGINNEDHYIRLAVSRNNAKTWRPSRVVLAPEGGAWNPTAMVVDDEIWIYYFDGTGEINMYRQRLKLDGRTKIKDPVTNKAIGPELVCIQETANTPCNTENPTIRMINQDIHMLNGRGTVDNKYVLVGNVAYKQQIDNTLRDISRYISDDGLNFYTSPNDTNPIFSLFGHVTQTPNVEVLQDYGDSNNGGITNYDVYFGLDNTGDSLPIHSEYIMRINLDNQ